MDPLQKRVRGLKVGRPKKDGSTPKSPAAMQLAARIISARMAKGWSQATLALEIGLSQQMVSAWERGRCWPHTKHLRRLCAALNVDLDAFLRPPVQIPQTKPPESLSMEGCTAAEQSVLRTVYKVMRDTPGREVLTAVDWLAVIRQRIDRRLGGTPEPVAAPAPDPDGWHEGDGPAPGQYWVKSGDLADGLILGDADTPTEYDPLTEIPA